MKILLKIVMRLAGIVIVLFMIGTFPWALVFFLSGLSEVVDNGLVWSGALEHIAYVGFIYALGIYFSVKLFGGKWRLKRKAPAIQKTLGPKDSKRKIVVLLGLFVILGIYIFVELWNWYVYFGSTDSTSLRVISFLLIFVFVYIEWRILEKLRAIKTNGSSNNPEDTSQ
jgi:hypothetical protein